MLLRFFSGIFEANFEIELRKNVNESFRLSISDHHQNIQDKRDVAVTSSKVQSH